MMRASLLVEIGCEEIPFGLVAKAAGKPGELEWNVVLQGKDETVFFDI